MAQQNLDFNIVAHTKGMEAIATMINRVGALEAETKRLAAANATLSSSTDAVIRNGVRYNNAMDAQSRQLRQARQGTQQLGMQINDFATSVSSGSSVTQALTQQLGQVGYAMSMMGGAAGKIGSFLAGPWGAAVLIGAMALGPIIDKLFQSGEAAEEAAQKHYKYLDAVSAGNMAELIKAEGELTKLQERRMVIGTKADKANRGLLFGGNLIPKSPKAEMEEIDQQIRWMQLAVNRGNKAREDLAKINRKTVEAARSGGRAASTAAQKITPDMSKVDLTKVEGSQKFISDIIKKGEAEWAAYLEKGSGVAASAMSTIVDINEMAMASVETLGDASSKGFVDRYQEIQNAFTSIGNAVNNSFKGMLTGAMSWKDGMKGIITAVIDELWKLYVVQQIVGFVSRVVGAATGFGGGGGMPTAYGAATSVGLDLSSGPKPFFGPEFANGTVNAPGGLALVGERGPELVNLPRGSHVIPAHRTQNMMGGINVSVDARGSSDPAAVRAQVQQGILEAAPAIIAAAQNRTVQGLRRPRLGGAMQ